MKTPHLLFVLTLSASLLSGCDEATTSATGGGGTLRISLAQPSAASMLKGRSSRAFSGAAVDSVVITRSRLVLRNIRFHNSDDSLDFRTAPLILTLQPGTALREIAVRSVPPGSFEEVRFELHRVESTDVASLPPAEQALFADFLAGERYSVIVEGVAYPTGSAAGEAFVFRSRINETQEFAFSPELIVGESQPHVNVTMSVDTGLWFRSADRLSAVDPRDPSQEHLIEENIKASVRVFEDSDVDGEDD